MPGCKQARRPLRELAPCFEQGFALLFQGLKRRVPTLFSHANALQLSLQGDHAASLVRTDRVEAARCLSHEASEPTRPSLQPRAARAAEPGRVQRHPEQGCKEQRRLIFYSHAPNDEQHARAETNE